MQEKIIEKNGMGDNNHCYLIQCLASVQVMFKWIYSFNQELEWSMKYLKQNIRQIYKYTMSCKWNWIYTIYIYVLSIKSRNAVSS